MEKHTTGLWITSGNLKNVELPSHLGDHWIGVYSDEAPIGHRMPAMCYGPDRKANARLIAAAPELLAALEGIYAWGCETMPLRKHSIDCRCPIHIAEEAICKATGTDIDTEGLRD